MRGCGRRPYARYPAGLLESTAAARVADGSPFQPQSREGDTRGNRARPWLPHTEFATAAAACGPPLLRSGWRGPGRQGAGTAGLTRPSPQRMTAEAHRRVVVEYLRAVMQKRISFRSAEERKEGAERMVREAEQLRFLFRKLASVSAPAAPHAPHIPGGVHLRLLFSAEQLGTT